MRLWDESHKCASNLPVPLCLVTPLKAEVLAADLGLRGLAVVFKDGLAGKVSATYDMPLEASPALLLGMLL